MESRRALFSWRVTRVLFSIATVLLVTGIIRLFASPSWLSLALVLLSLALFALSTRGPWDSEKSVRNRSVLGFRVNR